MRPGSSFAVAVATNAIAVTTSGFQQRCQRYSAASGRISTALLVRPLRCKRCQQRIPAFPREVAVLSSSSEFLKMSKQSPLESFDTELFINEIAQLQAIWDSFPEEDLAV